MVMDAGQQVIPPSPHSVGCEFVRQYYTLLNISPHNLHLFYNSNSMFIHGNGGIAVGQSDIRRRIMQLNFNDCHTRISQVDAQYTIGNSVVVQVTGELSNNGQPMRRFTQTFVLCAQTPKNYYVHNDIFRYQDAYSDDEHEAEPLAAELDKDQKAIKDQLPTLSADQQTQAGGAHLANGIVCAEPQAAVTGQFVSNSASNSAPPPATPLTQQLPSAHDGSVQQIYYPMRTVDAVLPINMIATAPPPSGALPNTYPNAANLNALNVQMAVNNQVNGIADHDDLTMSPSAKPYNIANADDASENSGANNVGPNSDDGSFSDGITEFQQGSPASQAQQNLKSATNQQIDSKSSVGNRAEETTKPIIGNNDSSFPSAYVNVNAPIVEDFKTINEQQQQEKYEAAKQQTNEPKTYANLFKSSNASSFVNATYQQQQQLQQQQTLSNTYQTSAPLISNNNSYASQSAASGTAFGGNRTATSSDNYNANNGTSLSQRNNNGRGSKEYEPRRQSGAAQFGEGQQLFLGNIPHTATESDLREIFVQFGSVVELRILAKPGNKTMGGGTRNTLNYGFITFVDSESAQKCLASGPHYFNDGTTNQVLNVEEKKARMRNDMPQRQNSGGRSGGGGSGAGGGSLMRTNNNGTGGPRLNNNGTYNRSDGRSHSNSGLRNNSTTQGGGYGRR